MESPQGPHSSSFWVFALSIKSYILSPPVPISCLGTKLLFYGSFVVWPKGCLMGTLKTSHHTPMGLDLLMQMSISNGCADISSVSFWLAINSQSSACIFQGLSHCLQPLDLYIWCLLLTPQAIIINFSLHDHSLTSTTFIGDSAILLMPPPSQ